MGIFRGTGGSSIASTDAGVDQVTQDALAAQNSAESASQSASAASTSASDAASSASSAQTHADSASASSVAASASATAAASSATAAANAVTEINEVTEASVVQHEAALTITESQISDLGSYITGNQTITLTGDVTGSGSTSIAVTIVDDSHNHVISNIDGLQTALDAKIESIPAEYLTETEGDAKYLQSFTEINDLSAAVVWANIPDANVPQSAVTQHQAALAITAGQISGLSYYTDADVDTHLNTGTATGSQILSWTGADYDWVDVTGGDVVDDVTPQLGGNLDLNSSDITGTGNINITGDVSANGVLSYNSGYGSSAPAYGIRAWVATRGTLGDTIDESANVSSIGRFGGTYTINFTTPMPDNNYAVLASGNDGTNKIFVTISSRSTTNCEVTFYDTGSGSELVLNAFVAIVR